MEKIKLTKEQVQLFEHMGTLVNVNGRSKPYMSIPYWFMEVEDGVFEYFPMEDEPDSLKKITERKHPDRNLNSPDALTDKIFDIAENIQKDMHRFKDRQIANGISPYAAETTYNLIKIAQLQQEILKLQK